MSKLQDQSHSQSMMNAVPNSTPLYIAHARSIQLKHIRRELTILDLQADKAREAYQRLVISEGRAKFITLTRRELIDLLIQRNRWRHQHKRILHRCQREGIDASRLIQS